MSPPNMACLMSKDLEGEVLTRVETGLGVLLRVYCSGYDRVVIGYVPVGRFCIHLRIPFGDFAITCSSGVNSRQQTLHTW